MKSTEGCHVELILCNCPYCNKELNFFEHEFVYESNPKSTKEVCKYCGKQFWLKPEDYK